MRSHLRCDRSDLNGLIWQVAYLFPELGCLEPSWDLWISGCSALTMSPMGASVHPRQAAGWFLILIPIHSFPLRPEVGPLEVQAPDPHEPQTFLSGTCRELGPPEPKPTAATSQPCCQ